MLDRFRRTAKNFLQPVIVICIVLISTHTFLFAQTYSIPQTTLVSLAWDANDPTPDGYRVYQRIEGEAYDYSQPVVSSSKNTATVLNLNYDTRYYFVVRAYVGTDESGDSNEVSFESNSTSPFTITASAGTNGALAPCGNVSVSASADQTFTIAADDHYNVSEVIIDGVSVGALSSYTFKAVTTDHTISAVFTPELYTIYATAGANGSIMPSAGAFVAYGDDYTYNIMSDGGYDIADVIVDGKNMGPISSYTFSAVSANHTISATFSATPMDYTIISSADAGGAISPAGTLSALEGSSQTYLITAESGYAISDIMVDGESVGPAGSYVFTDLHADHIIRAVFEKTSHTITASANGGGTISPSGPVTVLAGAGQIFTLSATDGYQVDELFVDGVSQGAPSSYTFANVYGDHTIEARFDAVNQPPEADAGPDQTVFEQKLVTLVGSNSIDADDGIASFRWRQLSGPIVNLADPSADLTTFTAPAVDTNGACLTFELTVTDFSGVSVKDTCIVNVTNFNHPPVADAGLDQAVDMLDFVTLDGSFSSDVDNDVLSFQWRQTGNGPVVSLVNANSATLLFTAPKVDSGGASVAFELTVTDSGGLQARDTCMVTIRAINLAPIADAGSDQTVHAGREIVLDGSASSDIDGKIVKYRWKQTQGSPVQLFDASAAVTTFIAPQPATDNDVLVFELTVTDDQALQDVDTCQEILAQTVDTTAPVLQLVDPASTNIKVSTDVISIAGTAWDDSEVAQVRWADDMGNGGIAQGTSEWHIDNLDLAGRRKTTLTVTASDAAGNESSVTLRIFLR